MTKPRKAKRKPRPATVTIRTLRDGSIKVTTGGDNPPDLRDVMPGFLAGTRKAR